jgi:hypothetical protein
MALNYGNKLKTILKIAVVSSVLGILTVLAAVVGITLEGRWAQANLWVLPMLFCVPFIMVPVIAVTACFSVRVTDRMVQSVFLGRFVLKQYLIEDFERLDVYPHSLIFRGGRKIRVYTIPDEVEQLLQHIILKKTALGSGTVADFLRGGEPLPSPSFGEGYTAREGHFAG